MSFNSYVFILLFLPLSLFGYFFLNRFKAYRISKYFMIAMSLWFYLFLDYRNIFFLLPVILINYLFHRVLSKKQNKPVLIVALTFNIGILFFFKYLNFTLASINSLLTTSIPFIKIAQPLAISFLTFSNISFLVDIYHEEINECSFSDYLLYAVYYPKMIQGPITFYQEFMNQFNDEKNKKWNWENAAKGLFYFSIGLSKKVLIADVFSEAVNFGFSDVMQLDTINTIIVSVAYFFQIYFDFSGYSDMASGISLMFNIDLPLNFNSPYKAVDIGDFWKRWHISLTRFFTKYLYIPLGGNRKGKLRTVINTLIVFVISGLWHGANWTFVLWGLLNGLALVIHRELKNKNIRIPKVISWFFTMLFVGVCWILFRSDSIKDAIQMIKNILESNFVDVYYGVYMSFFLEEISILEKLILGKNYIGPKHFILAYFVICFIICFVCRNPKEYMEKHGLNLLMCIASAVLLFWSIISLGGITVFIYQGF